MGNAAKRQALESPQDLEEMVSSNNYAHLYHSLRSVSFSYGEMYNYLLQQFFDTAVEFDKARSSIASDLMDVSESTFYRWKNRRNKVEEKHAEQLTLLIELYQYGQDVFGSKVQFLEWLTAPNLHFEDASPIEFLNSASGFRLVRHLLDKIEYGAPL